MGAVVIVCSGRSGRIIVRIGDCTDIGVIATIDRNGWGRLITSSGIARCRGLWLWGGGWGIRLWGGSCGIWLWEDGCGVWL